MIEKRPFFLTILCLFSFIYFTILAILFIAGFFYSGWVTEAINLYLPVRQFTGNEINAITGILSILLLSAITGIAAMWKMRRWGYYLFGTTSLLLASIQLIRPEVSISGTLIFVSLLILFGLYFRRLR